MSRLSFKQLLAHSESVEALKNRELIYERMNEISHKFTYFTVNTDLIGVYFLEDRIRISVNGTNTLREAIGNLRIRKTHEGFHVGFYEVAVGILNELLSMKAVMDSELPLEFDGHSRGGLVLITDALFRLQDSTGRETSTTTLGSPRLMNKKGTELLESLGVIHHRAHAKYDFIDNLAPRCFGYRHYETEEYALGTARGRIDHTSYSKILKAEISCLT